MLIYSFFLNSVLLLVYYVLRFSQHHLCIEYIGGFKHIPPFGQFVSRRWRLLLWSDQSVLWLKEMRIYTICFWPFTRFTSRISHQPTVVKNTVAIAFNDVLFTFEKHSVAFSTNFNIDIVLTAFIAAQLQRWLFIVLVFYISGSHKNMLSRLIWLFLWNTIHKINKYRREYFTIKSSKHYYHTVFQGLQFHLLKSHSKKKFHIFDSVQIIVAFLLYYWIALRIVLQLVRLSS